MNEIERAIRFYEQSPDGQYDELAAEALRQMLARMAEGQLVVISQNPQTQMTATEVLERQFSTRAPEIAQNIKMHNAIFGRVQASSTQGKDELTRDDVRRARWISVGESLPEVGVMALVAADFAYPVIVAALTKEGEWVDVTGWIIVTGVTHWQPIYGPTPP